MISSIITEHPPKYFIDITGGKQPVALASEVFLVLPVGISMEHFSINAIIFELMRLHPLSVP